MLEPATWMNDLCIITLLMKRIIFLLFLAPLISWGQLAKPLQFSEEIHDFGYIGQGAGAAVYQFDFTNITNRPVKILSVQASCGCTTPDWSKDPILPGNTGFVQASFNPKGRPGFFNKSLTVTTDFDSNPIILQIKGNVSTSADSGPADSEFRSSAGNWKLMVSSFNLGKIFIKDEFAMKEFPILNGGSHPVTFLRTSSPAYIRADVVPATLKPGEQGNVRISFNGKLKNKYGFQSDNIEIYTDDVLQPIKSFSVYATLEEFFPPLSQEELAKAPQLRTTESAFDLGRLKQNIVGTKDVSIFNAGKKELIIREVQENCTCVKASVTKSVLKPGESTLLKIEFNPQDRQGTQQKRVTIYSNDPANPVQAITFTAYVGE